jgi:hypothetical protein
MVKKNKVQTPAWILEGFDSEADYNKKIEKGSSAYPKPSRSATGRLKNTGGKTFTLRECPKCGSDEVGVVLGGSEGKGSKGWECRKCKWNGTRIEEKELTEDEFMAYLDKKGEAVA